MRVHKFSEVIVGEDGQTGGFSPVGAISVEEHSTVALPAGAFTPETPEILGLELRGLVLGTHGREKFSGVFALSLVDAGNIAGALVGAMQRLESAEAESDFKVGFHMGQTGKTFEDVGREIAEASDGD